MGGGDTCLDFLRHCHPMVSEVAFWKLQQFGRAMVPKDADAIGGRHTQGRGEIFKKAGRKCDTGVSETASRKTQTGGEQKRESVVTSQIIANEPSVKCNRRCELMFFTFSCIVATERTRNKMAMTGG
jgi:hypothetical protein